jgi:hypothetical protein
MCVCNYYHNPTTKELILGFQMVLLSKGFYSAKKLTKPDWKLNGYLITGPEIKWFINFWSGIQMTT